MTDEFMMTDNLGKGEVNYGKIIFIQIARINYLGSRAIQKYPEYREEWINSIIILARTISPKIKDKKTWETKKKEIKTGITEWGDYFEYLMECCQTADLLPAEYVTMYDKGLE